MNIEIRELRKKDHQKAIQFAIKGMHFDWYLDRNFQLKLYGKYFWYKELTQATQIIAAYIDDEFAGVLLAKLNGEERTYSSFTKSLYIKFFDFLASTFFKGGVDVYDEVNKTMYEEYSNERVPDGEILFLASNPELNVKGIGSMLLREFESRESGKEVYLYTDNACTYQFYEHRGFDRSCEKDIKLVIGNKTIPLNCLFYTKVIE